MEQYKSQELITIIGKEYFTNDRGRMVYPSVGDGWYAILHEMLTQIKPLLEKSPNFRILDIKEKFGYLMIYTSDSSHEIEEVIKEAGKKAFETCECCGDKGLFRYEGWIKVKCDRCHQRQN